MIEGNVLFLDSSFKYLMLVSNQFTNFVSFGDMTQHPAGADCSFFNTVFSSHVDFIGFVPNNKESVDFRQTTFKKKPIIDSFPLEFSQDVFLLENEGIFRTLKQIAQANNNHWLEVQYQALELRCARALPPDSLTFLQKIQHVWRHLPNYAFDWLSGYGVSIKKPIRAWLLVTFLCCLVQYGSVKNKVPPYYHFCSTSLVCKVSDRSNTTPVSWNEALQFHFSPSIPSFLNDNFYLKELRQNYYKDGRIPALSRFVRLIQSLMTYVCLFLVGLALRNRFKL